MIEMMCFIEDHAMASFMFELLMWPIEWVLDKVLNVVLWRKSAEPASDDPVYDKNVQRLIERNRELEK